MVDSPNEDGFVKSEKKWPQAKALASTVVGPTYWETQPGWGEAFSVIPSENEIRIREAAIALTIDYFKHDGPVDLNNFDAQLQKFYQFLLTGAVPTGNTIGTTNV